MASPYRLDDERARAALHCLAGSEESTTVSRWRRAFRTGDRPRALLRQRLAEGGILGGWRSMGYHSGCLAPPTECRALESLEPTAEPESEIDLRRKLSARAGDHPLRDTSIEETESNRRQICSVAYSTAGSPHSLSDFSMAAPKRNIP